MVSTGVPDDRRATCYRKLQGVRGEYMAHRVVVDGNLEDTEITSDAPFYT
ncbi:hypothetical protein [Desulfosediminicola flagellatus]